MDCFILDDEEFGKIIHFNFHFFFLQETARGAPPTFVPELHSWVNATTDYGIHYPPPFPLKKIFCHNAFHEIEYTVN